MEWTRKTIKKLGVPTAVFFAITLISVGSLVLPLWNYTRFYLALWNFDYLASSVTVDRSQINATRAMVNVTFLIMNPTDYSGLQVASISCRLQYLQPNHGHFVIETTGYRASQQRWTYWWNLRVASTTQSSSVGSNTEFPISIVFVANPYSSPQSDQQNAYDFISYLEAPATQQIQWSLTCVLTLSTFIGSFDRTNGFEPITILS